MLLHSTQDITQTSSFSNALLNPSAPNNALYAPLNLPRLNPENLKNLNYKELALKIIGAFDFDINLQIFQKALEVYDNFDDKNCPINITKINENLYINELYHGPTRAFKDMALQPFGVLLEYLKKDDFYLIMCATSGDTGPATLKSFENKKNIKVVCIYPNDGTSKTQALQMIHSKACNLKSIAIKGNFDDAQNALKTLLNDEEFKAVLKKENIHLSAANSVNFGRILFQIIYHYYASLKLDKNLDIIIPSGNFGDALGAYYAKKMGAKISKIKIASNSNNILSEFFNSGRYDLRTKTLQKTISPAMDILISSNIERLLFDKFKDQRTKELMLNLKNEKFYELNFEELKLLQEDFEADFCTDEECMHYIKQYQDYLLDPHTCTCFKMLDSNTPTLITSTAQWSKFTPSMYKALFNKECLDEKKAMQEIANQFNQNIHPNIACLFEQEDIKVKTYKIDDLKQTIIDWIKQ
ncbi:threonine synthase [Campylobacter volucris]|uniref:Threonine synthase n=1 Tax=Campylobacter volucris TaxID=1031542 RepID=A0AAE6CZK8_9BACT|nr:threonine synthase [Campylobacter volucris]AJC94179.1 threonine synthase [Campylobacter volucris LMG 24379]KAB0580337.1 threonine synthase [Campylobacter volucris]QBL13450.1 threonine synthase [Campylobacter volucris]QEL08395.1 threonine synthase [Campylobacter volucris]TXK70486.1 threonine synthase [Campylobacter volucris]